MMPVTERDFCVRADREPHEVAVIPMERQQLQAGREQWQTALARFDQCWARTIGRKPNRPRRTMTR